MQTNEPKLIKLETFSPFQLLNKVKQIENFEHPMISIKVRNYLKDKSLDIEKLSSPLYLKYLVILKKVPKNLQEKGRVKI